MSRYPPSGSNSTPPPSYLGGNNMNNVLMNNNNNNNNSNNNNNNGIAESAFASASAIQQLLPSASAPIDEQVHVLRGALVVTMEEVERLRGSMMVENGKLQRELRDVVRTVQQTYNNNNNNNNTPANTDNLLRPGNNNNNNAGTSLLTTNPPLGFADDYNSRLEYLEQAIRGIQQHQSLHTPVAMENAISQCSIFLRKADTEVQRVVQQMQEKMNSWQKIMDSFVVQGREQQQVLNNNNNNNNNNTTRENSYVDPNNNGIAGRMSRDASMAGMYNNNNNNNINNASSSSQQNNNNIQNAYANLDVVNDVKKMVQGRIMELSSYIDQELAAHRGSIISLEDKMGAVIETVAQMETENSAFRVAVSRPHLRNAMVLQASSKIDTSAAGMQYLSNSLRASGMMTSPSVVEDFNNNNNNNASPIRNTNINNINNNASSTLGGTPTPPMSNMNLTQQQQQQQQSTPAGKRNLIDSSTISVGALRSSRAAGNAGPGGSTAEAIQNLLREFTAVESSVIKDEILKQLDGDANLTRRRLEERTRSEQVTGIRGDIVRVVTALETIQEDHTRQERQQQDIHRAFQRLEQQFNLLQHKTEGDVRAELGRMEALQKSFFVRQEQLIAAERQTMITNVTEEVSRIQQKHADEMRLSERRRMDDLQAAQKQIRDDFVAFAEKQRKDLDGAVTNVKDDFTNLSTQANDNVARSLANATDATRRSFLNTTDEMRKNYSKIADDMRRLQAATEDHAKRSGEQQSFLQQRLQQVIDEQVVRVDRMGDDLALRLNGAIEEEVRRMTQSSENALQRAFGTVDDRQTRDSKAMREEISSLRQALHAMNAPSSALQSVDSRVDALRNDVQEMFESIATLKRNEPRIVQDTRRDVNTALETARSEITRNVGVQLQQFDGTLSELHRESLQRSQELTSLQIRLDQAIQSGTIVGTPTATTTTSMNQANYFGNNNGNPNNNNVATSRYGTGSYAALNTTPVVASGRTGSNSNIGGYQNNNNNNQQMLSSAGIAPPPGNTGIAGGSRTPSSSQNPPKRDALQGAFDV